VDVLDGGLSHVMKKHFLSQPSRAFFLENDNTTKFLDKFTIADMP